MEMKVSRRVTTLLLTLTICFIGLFLVDHGATADGVVFTTEFTENPKTLAAGKKIWVKQCAKCHGQRAYPGKAPKLKPSKYTIEFVYRRITKGFRGMPSWKKKYGKLDRMSVAAYVMSPDFVQ